MAFFETAWYCNAGDQSTTGHYAVTKRPQNTAVAAGILRRQFTAPAVGSERVFVCIVAGTTANVTDATWTLTRGGKTTDGTATWQECTGMAAVNGDATNTVSWAAMKAISSIASLGVIIKRNSGASYQICSTAGTVSGSEPAFSDTAGVTTNDGTAVWTSLGPVGNFTGGQAPHARLSNLFGTNWFIAGNTVYVGDNHAESQTSNMTMGNILGASSGVIAKILCHNHSGSYPPATGDLMTGASVATTGAANITITISGSVYFDGIAFKSGSTSTSSANLVLTLAAAAANQAWAYYKNCSFQLTNASASAYMQIGPPSGTLGFVNITFENCTASFAAVTQYMCFTIGQFAWKNTGTILAGGSSVPTSLLSLVGAVTQDVVLEALDLSQLTGNIATFPALATGGAMGSILIKDCKLNASGAIVTPLTTGYTVQLVRSSS